MVGIPAPQAALSDTLDKVRKLLALAGNNPSEIEASAAWEKAQALLRSLNGKPPTDVQLSRWFYEDAVPCPWMLQINHGLSGKEYVAVVARSMLRTDKNAQTLPTWRTAEVPLAFRGASEDEILAACHDGRIPWRSLPDPNKHPGLPPEFRYTSP